MTQVATNCAEVPAAAREEGKVRIDAAYGRGVTLPRMSKHLRSLFENIGLSVWEWEEGARSKVPAPPQPLSLAGLEVEIEDGTTVRWSRGEREETLDRSKSKMRGLLRSLYSNDAGWVVVSGFGSVSWKKDADEIKEIALNNDVMKERERTEGSEFWITVGAIRDLWTDGTYRLLRDADETRLVLTGDGLKLIGDLLAWRFAKMRGVPLGKARDNESLPAGYLSSRERRDPGRYRTRGLYEGTVEGAPYYKKKGLLVQGTPPEMEGKHQTENEEIQELISNAEVQAGTLFGQGAAPAEYVDQCNPKACGGRKTYVILENDMVVSVREALYVDGEFPDGIWTTARIQMTVERAWTDETREYDETFAAVVNREGEILAMIAPYEKSPEEVRVTLS